MKQGCKETCQKSRLIVTEGLLTEKIMMEDKRRG